MLSDYTRHVAVILALTFAVATNVAAQDHNDDELADQFGLQYWNKLKPEAIQTESGLQYKILIEGKGPKPRKKDSVMVHSRGLLLDGFEFDNSYGSDEPIKLKLRKVIDGWTEGIQLMPVGSVYVFLIPPELAYGKRKVPSIPPNSTLIFSVELFGIK